MKPCIHGIDTPRDARGRCKACRSDAEKAQRKGQTLHSDDDNCKPPKGWTCPTCKTQSLRWFCSTSCRVLFDARGFWGVGGDYEVVI